MKRQRGSIQEGPEHQPNSRVWEWDERRKEIIEEIFLHARERQEPSVLKEPLKAGRTNMFTAENPGKKNTIQGLERIWKKLPGTQLVRGSGQRSACFCLSRLLFLPPSPSKSTHFPFYPFFRRVFSLSTSFRGDSILQDHSLGARERPRTQTWLTREPHSLAMDRRRTPRAHSVSSPRLSARAHEQVRLFLLGFCGHRDVSCGCA